MGTNPTDRWPRLVRTHIALAAVCVLFLSLVTTSSAESSNQAGLIIDYGDGSISWVWVPFDGETISMTDMLESSDLDVVTVGFGGMGDAICQIETTGCPPSECRSRMCQSKSSDPFWRLMKLEGDSWQMVSTGADGTNVQDGEVVAMSWSSEMPNLPIVSVDDVATHADVDTSQQQTETSTKTTGQMNSDDTRTNSWIPIAGSVGAVLLAAGLLIVRGRRTHQVQG